MTNQIEPRRPRLTINRSPIPASPVHPLAALATILLDNVFGAVEIADPLLILLTGLTVGVVNTVTVTLVQHFLAKDEWGASVAKGMVMGVIAGVPFSVSGTAAGGLLLAWAGLHQWVQLPSATGGSNNEDDEVIDVNPK